MNPGLSATISASYDSARLMHVTGSGNPPECRRIMLSLMNIGNQSDESIGGHYQVQIPTKSKQ